MPVDYSKRMFLGLALFCCSPAFASFPVGESAELQPPELVRIVQCGERSDLVNSCLNVDPACCVLLEPAGGDVLPEGVEAVCQITIKRGYYYPACYELEPSE